METRRTIVPRNNSRDDSQGLIVHLRRFKEHHSGCAAVLWLERIFTMIDEPVHLGTASKNLPESSINHLAEVSTIP